MTHDTLININSTTEHIRKLSDRSSQRRWTAVTYILS